MNENGIQVWNYESSEIRTVQVNGEPWFVLSAESDGWRGRLQIETGQADTD